MTSIPTPVAAVLVWLFGVGVVLPACLLAWLKFERWVAGRRARRRAAGEVIEFAPAAARSRSRRPVPPAVDRKRNGRALGEGAGRKTYSRAKEEEWRE